MFVSTGVERSPSMPVRPPAAPRPAITSSAELRCESASTWTFVELECAEGVDVRALCDLVLELGLGASAVVVAGGEEEIFHEREVSGNVWTGEGVNAPPPPKLWERSVVRVMLFPPLEGAPGVPVEEQVANMLEAVQLGMGLAAPPPHRVVEEPAIDWVTAVARATFEPICVDGGRLWVLPEWWEGDEPQGAQHVIRLDPGAAFGDGQHQTTRLCLEWAVRNVRAGDRVLDFGCGTGILALGAMLAGARSAHGVDIEPEALEASRRNAAGNGYADQENGPLRFYSGPAFDEARASGAGAGEKYDVLLANILFAPLVELAPKFASLLRPGGQICVSGFVVASAEKISEVYAANGFEITEARTLDDWVCLAATRRSDD
eukprot:tig00000821_g4464.t1